jgi:hypothetical protein
MVHDASMVVCHAQELAPAQPTDDIALQSVQDRRDSRTIQMWIHEVLGIRNRFHTVL